jgi:hypothetical protein
MVKTMSGFSRRKRQLRIVFRPWVWLLLAIYCAWLPADATGRGHLFRSSEVLSTPSDTLAVVATTAKTQQSKDPLPAPLHLAPPACLDLLLSFHTSLDLQEDAPFLLPPFATWLTPSFPRPPPTA